VIMEENKSALRQQMQLFSAGYPTTCNATVQILLTNPIKSFITRHVSLVSLSIIGRSFTLSKAKSHPRYAKVECSIHNLHIYGSSFQVGVR
jgi:hypothetical protein